MAVRASVKGSVDILKFTPSETNEKAKEIVERCGEENLLLEARHAKEKPYSSRLVATTEIPLVESLSNSFDHQRSFS